MKSVTDMEDSCTRNGEKRRSSILKHAKSPKAGTEEFSRETQLKENVCIIDKHRRHSKRVSFADTCQIQEFCKEQLSSRTTQDDCSESPDNDAIPAPLSLLCRPLPPKVQAPVSMLTGEVTYIPLAYADQSIGDRVSSDRFNQKQRKPLSVLDPNQVCNRENDYYDVFYSSSVMDETFIDDGFGAEDDCDCSHQESSDNKRTDAVLSQCSDVYNSKTMVFPPGRDDMEFTTVEYFPICVCTDRPTEPSEFQESKLAKCSCTDACTESIHNGSNQSGIAWKESKEATAHNSSDDMELTKVENYTIFVASCCQDFKSQSVVGKSSESSNVVASEKPFNTQYIVEDMSECSLNSKADHIILSGSQVPQQEAAGQMTRSDSFCSNLLPTEVSLVKSSTFMDDVDVVPVRESEVVFEANQCSKTDRKSPKNSRRYGQSDAVSPSGQGNLKLKKLTGQMYSETTNGRVELDGVKSPVKNFTPCAQLVCADQNCITNELGSSQHVFTEIDTQDDHGLNSSSREPGDVMVNSSGEDMELTKVEDCKIDLASGCQGEFLLKSQSEQFPHGELPSTEMVHQEDVVGVVHACSALTDVQQAGVTFLKCPDVLENVEGDPVETVGIGVNRPVLSSVEATYVVDKMECSDNYTQRSSPPIIQDPVQDALVNKEKVSNQLTKGTIDSELVPVLNVDVAGPGLPTAITTVQNSVSTKSDSNSGSFSSHKCAFTSKFIGTNAVLSVGQSDNMLVERTTENISPEEHVRFVQLQVDPHRENAELNTDAMDTPVCGTKNTASNEKCLERSLNVDGSSHRKRLSQDGSHHSPEKKTKLLPDPSELLIGDAALVICSAATVDNGLVPTRTIESNGQAVEPVESSVAAPDVQEIETGVQTVAVFSNNCPNKSSVSCQDQVKDSVSTTFEDLMDIACPSLLQFSLDSAAELSPPAKFSSSRTSDSCTASLAVVSKVNPGFNEMALGNTFTKAGTEVTNKNDVEDGFLDSWKETMNLTGSAERLFHCCNGAQQSRVHSRSWLPKKRQRLQQPLIAERLAFLRSFAKSQIGDDKALEKQHTVTAAKDAVLQKPSITIADQDQNRTLETLEQEKGVNAVSPLQCTMSRTVIDQQQSVKCGDVSTKPHSEICNPNSKAADRSSVSSPSSAMSSSVVPSQFSAVKLPATTQVHQTAEELNVEAEVGKPRIEPSFAVPISRVSLQSRLQELITKARGQSKKRVVVSTKKQHVETGDVKEPDLMRSCSDPCSVTNGPFEERYHHWDKIIKRAEEGVRDFIALKESIESMEKELADVTKEIKQLGMSIARKMICEVHQAPQESQPFLGYYVKEHTSTILHLSFWQNILHLKFTLESSADKNLMSSEHGSSKNQKIVNIEKWYNLEIDSGYHCRLQKCPIRKFAHQLMWMEFEKLGIDLFCRTTDDLQKMLPDLVSFSNKAKMLYTDMKNASFCNVTSLTGHEFSIEFNSQRAFLNFVLIFTLDLQTYPDHLPSPKLKVIIGKVSVEEVLAAFTTVVPGPFYLCNIIFAIKQWLDTRNCIANSM